MNPTPRPNPILLALLAAAFAPQAFADNPADTPADSQNSPQAAAEPAFTLGEITVRGRRDTAADESVVRAADIRRSNSRDIAQALATQPSVSIDFSGGRNETGIRVRGFDARQVPLFLDGIPQYVPYDGYVDFARFPTPRPGRNPHRQSRRIADVRLQHHGRRDQPRYPQTAESL